MLKLYSLARNPHNTVQPSSRNRGLPNVPISLSHGLPPISYDNLGGRLLPATFVPQA